MVTVQFFSGVPIFGLSRLSRSSDFGLNEKRYWLVELSKKLFSVSFHSQNGNQLDIQDRESTLPGVVLSVYFAIVS